MRLRRLAAAAAVALSTGCAAAPLTGPRQGGAPWSELRSKHFVLETDVAPAIARERLAEFEVMYQAVGSIIRHREAADPQPIEIVLFHRQEDFVALTGREQGLGGYFVHRPPGDLEPRPALVFTDSVVTATQGVFLHEITHRLIHENFAEPPVWLDEGLAQYFSTLRIDGNRMTLGERLPEATFTNASEYSEEWYLQDRQVRLEDVSMLDRRSDLFARYRQKQIPSAMAPSVATLLGASRDAFYVWTREGEPTEAELRVQSAYYVGAWRLVHLLSNGPDAVEREHFQGYLAALAAGTRTGDAFRTAFGDDGAARLEASYRRELTNPRIGVRTVTFVAQPAPTSEPRELSDAAVHLLWARHRPWKSVPSEAARADVVAALVTAPGEPGGHYQRAVFEIASGQLELAAQDLDAALAKRPLEPRYLFARILVEEQRSGAAHVRSGVSSALAATLAKTATTAPELDLVAQIEARGGGRERALAFAERAVAADPLCWGCQYTRATLLFAAGRLPEAHAAALRAIALLPEKTRSKPFTRLRADIERAMRARAEGAPAPPPP